MPEHPPRRRRRDGTGETVLAGIGLVAAALSAAFAALTLADSERQPILFATRHLLIFGRPATRGADRARPTPAADPLPIGALPATPAPDAEVQPLPPGPGPAAPGGLDLGLPRRAARPETAADRPPPASGRPLIGYVLRGIFNGRALVQGPAGFVLVAPGASIEGVGTVEAIEEGRGRRAVVTAAGIIAEPER